MSPHVEFSYFCDVKIFLAILGCAALALGLVGVFVPILPTTPFLLLAAALWLRSSERLHRWLLNHPYMGNYIRNISENRAMPLHTKVITLALLWSTIIYCIVALGLAWWWQVVLAVVLIGVTWHIASFKTLKK